MDRLHAGPFAPIRSLAGNPRAGSYNAAQFRDAPMDESAGMSAFVADGRSLNRIQVVEVVEAMAFKDPPDRSPSHGVRGDDLRVAFPFTPQGDDLGLQFWKGSCAAD